MSDNSQHREYTFNFSQLNWRHFLEIEEWKLAYFQRNGFESLKLTVREDMKNEDFLLLIAFLRVKAYDDVNNP